jgi:uncharacterized membrane protein
MHRMSTYQWLLGLHVVAAMLFLSAAVTVGLVHAAALRAGRPSEVASLLGLTRVGVLIVVVGALASLALGLALVAHLPYRSLGDTWIALALVLWAASVVLGAVGGRSARATRYLAERLAREGDEPSDELRRRLADPVSLALNYASLLSALAVLALMLWKPA